MCVGVHFGGILGALWGSCWVSRSCPVSGRSWGVVGLSGVALGAFLRPSWAVLGDLGGFLGGLGAVLAPLRMVLGASLRRPWDLFQPSRGRSLAIAGSKW